MTDDSSISYPAFVGDDRTIFVASRIDPGALAALGEQHRIIEAWDAPTSEHPRLIRGCDTIIFRSGVQITAELMQAAPNLSLLIRGGSGTDNVDLDYIAKHDLKLVRLPGPGARAVAEMAFTLMLSLARQVLFADNEWRRGNWVKHCVEGHLLHGKTLGVVGAGNIGTVVGEMGATWGMRVQGCVNNPSPDRRTALSKHGIDLTGFSEVITEADFLSIHLPLNDVTHGIIGEHELRAMKPTSFLINLARGGVVDEAALQTALVEGRLLGAALDVHVEEGDGKISPLADLPNTILTPHIGATTVDTQKVIGRQIIEVVEQFSD